jgi:hypothetical protein
MNQTETLRFRLVSCPRNTRYFAGGQSAVFQGGPSRTGGKAPISESYGSSEQPRKNSQLAPAQRVAMKMATPKLATSQIAAVRLWVQAFWSKRPGSPGSGGVYRPDRSFTPVRIHRLQVRNTISKSWGDVKWFGRRSLWAACNHGTVQEPIRHKRPPPPLSLRSWAPTPYTVILIAGMILSLAHLRTDSGFICSLCASCLTVRVPLNCATKRWRVFY